MKINQLYCSRQVVRSSLFLVLLSFAMPAFTAQVVDKGSTDSSLKPMNLVAMPIAKGSFNQRKYFKILKTYVLMHSCVLKHTFIFILSHFVPLFY